MGPGAAADPDEKPTSRLAPSGSRIAGGHRGPGWQAGAMSPQPAFLCTQETGSEQSSKPKKRRQLPPIL